MFAFALGNPARVTVLRKQASGDLFVFIHGDDVKTVPGVVNPSSVSRVFLQCLFFLPSYGISSASLASSNKLFISRTLVDLMMKDVLFCSAL